MGVLDDLLNPQNSRAVRQIASQTGVGEADARSALEHLAPAISRGVQRNIATEGGLESLLRALQSGNHGRYLDDPGQLGNAVDDGNNILGHVFGSKDVSRGVANQVSQETGIGADLLKRMLPLIASLVMGALARNASGSGFGGQPQPRSGDSGGGLGDILGSVLGGGQAPQSGGGLGDILGAALGGGAGAQQTGGGLGSILSSMLDSNRDGSAFDDILDMATRGRR
jgi:hypothetical protein